MTYANRTVHRSLFCVNFQRLAETIDGRTKTLTTAQQKQQQSCAFVGRSALPLNIIIIIIIIDWYTSLARNSCLHESTPLGTVLRSLPHRATKGRASEGRGQSFEVKFVMVDLTGVNCPAEDGDRKISKVAREGKGKGKR